MRKQSCYALYKGDQFIDLGTITELSERLNIKEQTLWFYTSKVYEKRSEQKNSDNLRILIKIEENDYDESTD
jgi:hypothetical protein